MQLFMKKEYFMTERQTTKADTIEKFVLCFLKTSVLYVFFIVWATSENNCFNCLPSRKIAVQITGFVDSKIF